MAAETRRHLAAALAGLPARQSAVVTMRDVAGHSSDEVCDLLSISTANPARAAAPRPGSAARRPGTALDQGDDTVNCDEFVELVTAYLDGALTPTDGQRFVEHLAECDGCDRYLEQVRTTVAALGRLPVQRLSPEARDRLLAAFRDWPPAEPTGALPAPSLA